VLAGVPLANLEPGAEDVADALLVCATELTTAQEIDRFARSLERELTGGTARRSRDTMAVPAGERG